MKTPLLFLALVVSLAGNVWFLVDRARAVAPTGGAASVATDHSATMAVSSRAAAAPAASAPVAASRPYLWRHADASVAALRAVAQDLRAAGCPPDVVARFIGAMLRERTHAEVARLPFWQLLSPGKEARKLQSQAAQELLRLQEEILGPSGSAVATLDPLQRRLQYGSLSDERVSALMKIDRDYNDLRADLQGNTNTFTREEVQARQEQQRALEKERLADITAALTPEEFAEWELRESGYARRVMNSLRNVTVTEDEYRTLVAAQKARDPLGTPYNFASLGETKDLPATYAYMDQVRAALGEERATAFLKVNDFAYAQAVSFTEKNPTVGVAKSYDLYKLQNEAQVLQNELNQRASSGATPGDDIAQRYASLNTRLDTLLGSAAAEAYRGQGMGFLFRSFRPRLTPATPPKG